MALAPHISARRSWHEDVGIASPPYLATHWQRPAGTVEKLPPKQLASHGIPSDLLWASTRILANAVSWLGSLNSHGLEIFGMHRRGRWWPPLREGDSPGRADPEEEKSPQKVLQTDPQQVTGRQSPHPLGCAPLSQWPQMSGKPDLIIFKTCLLLFICLELCLDLSSSSGMNQKKKKALQHGPDVTPRGHILPTKKNRQSSGTLRFNFDAPEVWNHVEKTLWSSWSHHREKLVIYVSTMIMDDMFCNFMLFSPESSWIHQFGKLYKPIMADLHNFPFGWVNVGTFYGDRSLLMEIET